MRLAWLAALMLFGQQAVAYDRPLRGPILGASTDLGQTWSPALITSAAFLPLKVFRDEVFWANVETDRGRFLFDNPRSTYPDLLTGQGAQLLFLVNNPHPKHDGGTTPWTEAGVQAFAHYTAEVLRRFPGINTLEIGNEMNSETFAWGPGWDGPLSEQAASYVRLLAATEQAARQVRPEVEVLGGAAHSIPIAWFREIFALGAADHMDALVIHPYTVRPEQLARQIALLRDQVPQTANMPIAVTEFGQKDEARAPADLVKSYCQQALAGVTQSIWYPLNPRGDGLAALLSPEGTLTATGETFRFLQSHFQGKPVANISPDPFTYGCRFGSMMVLWGEPRDLALAPGVEALDLSGMPLPKPPARLSPDVPLILQAEGALNLGADVKLGLNNILADSWHQFAYSGTSDPFTRLVRQGGRDTPLSSRPGQERDGVPWTPYLGTDLDGEARATAEWVQPSDPPAGAVAIVTQYRAPRPVDARIEVRLNPWDAGIDLSILLNGKVLQSAAITAEKTVSVGPVALSAGDVVDVVAGPQGKGGGAALRVVLFSQ